MKLPPRVVFTVTTIASSCGVTAMETTTEMEHTQQARAKNTAYEEEIITNISALHAAGRKILWVKLLTLHSTGG